LERLQNRGGSVNKDKLSKWADFDYELAAEKKKTSERSRVRSINKPSSFSDFWSVISETYSYLKRKTIRRN